MRTEAMQKKLKLLRDGIAEIIPERKASAFVSDVIVIEGPARRRANLIRSSVLECIGVTVAALPNQVMPCIQTDKS